MPIDKNMLNQLRQTLRSFESTNHVVVTREANNVCTDCYSSGGCKGTCRGTCGGGCSAY